MPLKFSGSSLLSKTNEPALKENFNSKKPPVISPGASGLGNFYSFPVPVSVFHHSFFRTCHRVILNELVLKYYINTASNKSRKPFLTMIPGLAND